MTSYCLCGCSKKMADRQYICAQHWDQVPADVRKAISALKPRKNEKPSQEYLDALKLAASEVAINNLHQHAWYDG